VAPNRVFVSGTVLDGWVISGRADLREGELLLRGGARFTVEEAAHVVAEVSGLGDAHGLVGRVCALGDLRKLDAEVMDRSMVVGDLAYDVVPGLLASPAGPGPESTEQTLAQLSALSAEGGAGQSDEELLARYLIERLE
jgi:hypothetical protein